MSEQIILVLGDPEAIKHEKVSQLISELRENFNVLSFDNPQTLQSEKDWQEKCSEAIILVSAADQVGDLAEWFSVIKQLKSHEPLFTFMKKDFSFNVRQALSVKDAFTFLTPVEKVNESLRGHLKSNATPPPPPKKPPVGLSTLSEKKPPLPGQKKSSDGAQSLPPLPSKLPGEDGRKKTFSEKSEEETNNSHLSFSHVQENPALADNLDGATIVSNEVKSEHLSQEEDPDASLVEEEGAVEILSNDMEEEEAAPFLGDSSSEGFSEDAPELLMNNESENEKEADSSALDDNNEEAAVFDSEEMDAPTEMGASEIAEFQEVGAEENGHFPDQEEGDVSDPALSIGTAVSAHAMDSLEEVQSDEEQFGDANFDDGDAEEDGNAELSGLAESAGQVDLSQIVEDRGLEYVEGSEERQVSEEIVAAEEDGLEADLGELSQGPELSQTKAKIEAGDDNGGIGGEENKISDDSLLGDMNIDSSNNDESVALESGNNLLGEDSGENEKTAVSRVEELIASESDDDSEPLQVLKRYAALKEREAREANAALTMLKKEGAKLVDRLKSSEDERRRLTIRNEDLQSQLKSLEDKDGEAQHQLQKMEEHYKEQVKDLKFQLEGSMFQARKLQQTLEDFRERVKIDIQKIRTREREYASRLELQKRDAESLLTSKDERLLLQQKEIDRLEFEMGNLKERLIEESDRTEDRSEKLSRALKSLKLAEGMLSGIDSESGLLSSALANLDDDNDSQILQEDMSSRQSSESESEENLLDSESSDEEVA